MKLGSVSGSGSASGLGSASGHGRWVENLFRPLVVGVMVGCIALSVAELMRLFSPDWSTAYFFVGCVLAAVEAQYTYRLIQTRILDGTDVWKVRAMEIVGFLILLKIGSYIGTEWTDVLADIVNWIGYPLEFIDLKTMSALILCLFSWFASTQTAHDLQRLHEPSHFHPHDYFPVKALTRSFFWGGAVLLLVSGLTRVGIAALLRLDRPSVPGLVLNALIYCVLGLVMLGQVQFVTLRKHWQEQKIQIVDRLAGRWVRYSLIFIGLAATLAFLLPTGYTVGLLELVGLILALVVQVINMIALLLMLLISIPLGLLAWLLGGSEGPVSRPAPLSPPPIQPGSTWVAPDWLNIVRSLFFWIVALGVLFYAIRTFLNDHPEVWEVLLSLGPIRVLTRLWTALSRWFGRWAAAVRERLPRRASLRRTRASSKRSGLFAWSGARSHREWVLYYYLNILRRAKRLGFARRAPQTPYEYTAVLKSNLPQARQELDSLTQAFVEARYSQHSVQPDLASRAKAWWQQIKAILQRRARAP